MKSNIRIVTYLCIYKPFNLPKYFHLLLLQHQLTCNLQEFFLKSGTKAIKTILRRGNYPNLKPFKRNYNK